MSHDEAEDQGWWERTWNDRGEVFQAQFGTSHPPGSPENYVASFYGCGFGREKVMIPGACLQVYRPQEGRDHWLYVTMGISQPSEPSKEPVTRDTYSGAGCEFAMMVHEPADWVADLLGGWMAYTLEKPLLVGHYFAGGFHELDTGKTSWFIGRDSDITTAGMRVVGPIRGFLFWPIVGVPRWFTTETGKFELLVATAITGDELAFRHRTSSAHLMVLLLETGVGQVSQVHRASALAGQGQSFAKRLEAMPVEDVVDHLAASYRLKLD